MARVTVSFGDYQEGRLPPICVISGRATSDQFVYRTSVSPPVEGRVESGGMLWRLERLMRTVDPRAPRNLLRGVIPVDSAVRRRLQLRHRLWTAALVLGIVGLLSAAWGAAAWSPPLAVGSTATILLAVVRRRDWERALPHPELSHGGSLVVVGNVHERFAAAVGDII